MEFFLLYAVLMYTCLRDVSTLRAQFDFVGLQLNRIFCITGNWRWRRGRLGGGYSLACRRRKVICFCIKRIGCKLCNPALVFFRMYFPMRKLLQGFGSWYLSIIRWSFGHVLLMQYCDVVLVVSVWYVILGRLQDGVVSIWLVYVIFEQALKRRSLLYCICRKPYDKQQAMIACDRCGEWYHYSCLNLPEPESEDSDESSLIQHDGGEFVCPDCQNARPMWVPQHQIEVSSSIYKEDIQ